MYLLTSIHRGISQIFRPIDKMVDVYNKPTILKYKHTKEKFETQIFNIYQDTLTLNVYLYHIFIFCQLSAYLLPTRFTNI